MKINAEIMFVGGIKDKVILDNTEFKTFNEFAVDFMRCSRKCYANYV